MLKPAHATKQIENWWIEGEDDDDRVLGHLTTKLNKAPAKIRNICYALFNANKDGIQDYLDETEEFERQQRKAFSKLTKAERKKVLQLLFGNLTASIEVALDWVIDPKRYRDQDSLFVQKLAKSSVGDAQFDYLVQINDLVFLNPPELNIEWLAAWIGHLQVNWKLYGFKYYQLLAAVIDKGGKAGKKVLEILLASGNKEHEIGIPGEHVNSTLLMADSVEGWEFVERLLLAAQRQEGLRQSLMDSLRRAHPAAFRRIFALIVEQNLTRYSSVLMEFNVWMGMEWEAKDAKKVNAKLAPLSEYLADIKLAQKVVKAAEDPESVYLALWAIAVVDVSASLKTAATLLKHDSPEFRFVATKLFAELSCYFDEAMSYRIEQVRDDDLRVVAGAILGVDSKHSYTPRINANNAKQAKSLFEVLTPRMEQLPRKAKKLSPLVWSWSELKISQAEAADCLVDTVQYPDSKESPSKIAAWIPMMSSAGRYSAIGLFTDQKKFDPETRSLLFEFAGDKSSDNSELALEAIAKLKLTEVEAKLLESYLSRSSTTYRQEVIAVLLKQTDKVLFGCIERLLQDGQKPRRSAGLELLRQTAVSEREVDSCIRMAEHYRDQRKKLTKEESLQIDAVLRANEESVSFENCLGLIDPADRTPSTPPVDRKVQGLTTATKNLIANLEKFVRSNKKTEITFAKYRDMEEMVTEPMGQVEYGFPSCYISEPIERQLKYLPSMSLFQDWFRNLPANCRDKDGFHLVRALAFFELVDDWEFDGFQKYLKEPSRRPLAKFLGVDSKSKKKPNELVGDILTWLVRSELPKGITEFCFDAAETVFARIPEADIQRLTVPPKQIKTEWGYDEVDPFHDFRQLKGVKLWLGFANRFQRVDPRPPKNFLIRQWDLEHWLDQPVEGASRDRPSNEVFVAAYEKKKANLADFYDHMIGPEDVRYGGYGLSHFSGRSFSKDFRKFMDRDEIKKAVATVQARLLELELARGEAATVSSQVALNFRCYRGIDTLRQLLGALGKKGFKQNNSWQKSTCDIRDATFTSMASNTYPGESETAADFTKMVKSEMKAGVFDEDRLLQLAFLAPQWSDWIGQALKWDGFDEAIYWFFAHLKYVWGIDDAFQTEEDLDAENDRDDDEDFDEDQPERLTHWERIIRERTDLTSDERSEGAIDVGWFHRVYERFTPKRWESIAAAARFAANSAQAKRAKLIGDVLLGKVAKKELVDGIKKRNLKENVRLIGLLPLAKGAKQNRDLLDRYEVLEGYRKYANGLSSMSRPEAVRAHEIGMQNLASTAGFADPMRLQWALEAQSTADLASGPLEVKKGDVRFVLELDSDAVPVTTVYRGEKVLKSLPKTVNKDKKFVALRDRAKHLKKQSSRIKVSLESAMCRADRFTGEELQQLSQHAVLWPQLQRLVLINETQLGYPVKNGKALKDFAGKTTSVKKADSLRIAHPYDLLETKQWPKWQRECFNIERLQPFKQVFRELYVVSAQEKKDKTVSRRYAGHQVNRKQAFALWGRRGWAIDEYDEVWKSIHYADLNVSVGFEHGVTTPLEVEGLTLETVRFSSRRDHKELPLTKVPPVLFSEVMRDLDLVVSVAHVGEVDPEISASTVELRRVLLTETCQLLGLKNVKLKPKSNFATIQGEIANYRIHLGSGVVHKLPGGSVCLVPVHSQHRGRLFLPFADNDPKTAEVLSKTLLLARDQEIDDPILLEQLRA